MERVVWVAAGVAKRTNLRRSQDRQARQDEAWHGEERQGEAGKAGPCLRGLDVSGAAVV